jgi:1-acyl-sn-glycerol-3-phosphate acyltransferase
MRPPPVAVRRFLIDPVWIPVATATALLFALVAAVSGAVAALTSPLGRRRMRPLRLSAFAALYLVVDAVIVLCCAAMWLRHPLPGRRDQARWSRAHLTLLRRALAVIVGSAGPLFGFRVQLQEPPDRDGIAGRPLLVLSRHGGPGDSFALVELLLSRYNRRPAIVLTETLRWDPGLDLLLGRLPSCFIRRGDGGQVPARLARLARDMTPDDAILLFPEGGNWTPNRHRHAIARLRRRGEPQAVADAIGNPNVLPPHPAGVLAVLGGRPDLDVAVVAHTGLEDLVSPGQIWRALPVRGRPMMVRWWYEPAARLPDTEPDRREWLRLQWAIVDAWIGARKTAGQELIAAAEAESQQAEPVLAEPLQAEPLQAEPEQLTRPVTEL